MRDVVAIGATLCCVVFDSESEASDPKGDSLRRFLDPFWFTSLRSLRTLLTSESLEFTESELATEAAILVVSRCGIQVSLVEQYLEFSKQSLCDVVVLLAVDYFSP